MGLTHAVMSDAHPALGQGFRPIKGCLLIIATLCSPLATQLSSCAAAGLAPLTVSFDGSESFQSRGATLDYLWDYKDGGATSKSAT